MINWQGYLIVLACVLCFVVVGIFLVVAGRGGRRMNDMPPGWRVGFLIWHVGGYVVIALGVLLGIGAVVLAIVD
ncbi:MAG: hypothetical protein GVY12_11780 [Bacteroidetes bacterium]|jgi:hypothetical protein|nr:hypothetical protein [Bacteroidota bacterium]